ncbi:MAG TPA: hypothetical protein VG328_06825 [Stellaceae bacterium]|jgi:hypothetical protein|nr:hypothetical protein [Stellaceae bacterium]
MKLGTVGTITGACFGFALTAFFIIEPNAVGAGEFVFAASITVAVGTWFYWLLENLGARRMSPIFLIVTGLVLVGGGGALLWFGISRFRVAPPAIANSASAPPPMVGIGGAGGAPVVTGDNNVVIGGPGGPGGIFGVGGAGGGGENRGNNMIVGGGAGGAAGHPCVWRHPAKSGYEVTQRARGLHVDPAIRRYGRGGAVPGYEEKLAVIQELRASYFTAKGTQPQDYFENINAVSAEYLNDQLASRHEPWRVRIVDEDEYEFFLPGCE